ncbi:MAG: M3 family oligoendopeptidase [Armatimonadetes bacterium]|nr:M3 family oligoendopeptidase [Armatimonadota bacterium]
MQHASPFPAPVFHDSDNGSASPAVTALPHWDVSAFFPSLESPEFDVAYDVLIAEIAALAALWDEHNIAARPTKSLAASPEIVRAYEAATSAYNAVLDSSRLVGGFIALFTTTNSRNDLAQAKRSGLSKHYITLGVCGTRYTAFLGSLDPDSLLAASELARTHEYYLREAQIAAQHQMSPVEEELSALLYPASGAAWSKLHGDLTSQLTVIVPKDGAETAHPMSVVRAMATDPDRETRRTAYHAELAAWKTVAVPLAGAMNAIKYETGALSQKRGWDSPIDSAAFGNHIDRATLDAMLSAARKSFPMFRRYLQAKARRVSGADKLPWYDLFAPVGDASQTFTWDEATAFITENFGAYSPKLRGFAERAFTEQWIDAEPRPGKRDGAFCMSVRGSESRIMQNFRPSFDGVSTLAHELGHGYHNLCLADRTPLQSGTPMTLAETASIFCETIVKQAVLKNADEAGQLAILDGSLQGQCQVVVDITSRFLFEKGVFEKRRERELSVDELCALMTQSQSDTYGDGLDVAQMHPFMWAVKGHYYGSTFYNFPYMFGLLFGLGLYAQYQTEGERFRPRYDELLSRTGMSDAASLADGFGINIRGEEFWTSSLNLIGQDAEAFAALAAKGV